LRSAIRFACGGQSVTRPWRSREIGSDGLIDEVAAPAERAGDRAEAPGADRRQLWHRRPRRRLFPLHNEIRLLKLKISAAMLHTAAVWEEEPPGLGCVTRLMGADGDEHHPSVRRDGDDQLPFQHGARSRSRRHRHAFFRYVLCPDVHRTEVYTNDYRTIDPEHEPVRWSLRHAGRCSGARRRRAPGSHKARRSTTRCCATRRSMRT
jgi:hypothetical protein